MQRVLQRVFYAAFFVLLFGVVKANVLVHGDGTILKAPAATPTITVGAVSGNITTCEHTASAAPNLQQFTITGSNLTAPVVVQTAPGFEIAVGPSSSYQTTLVIPLDPKSPGNASATIYVRGSSLAAAGPISGDIALGSTGAVAQQVHVSGMVYSNPTVNQITLPAYKAGQLVPAINFTGNADSFKWTSDNTAIGLVADNGINSIPSFTATNNGTTTLTAHIKVTQISNGGCNGADMFFDIAVKPVGAVVTLGSVSGSIGTCRGVPSADPYLQKFDISGSNLAGNILVEASSPNIEISAQPGYGFMHSFPITAFNGEVNLRTIYVRSSSSAPVGALAAGVRVTCGAFDKTIAISGTVSAQWDIDPIGPQVYDDNTAHQITFQGTAKSVKWVNDNPDVGLATNGSGTKIQFFAVNNSQAPLIAHIVAMPDNPYGCNGNSVSFTVTVKPSSVSPGGAVIHTAGSLPLLTTNYGTPSTAGSFNVSGDDMQTGITITPPADYEISTDDITFKKTLTIGSAGSIPSTMVYIRLAKTSPIGNYPGQVVLSSAGAADAMISVNSSDAVSPALLTITADNKTKITGTENPQLTASYTGFVNNESPAVLTNLPVLSTTAVLNSPPGVYLVKATGATAVNYKFSYVDGSLTIKPQPVNIVVSNAFSPNGDGINDSWLIKNIDVFPNSVVQIFSRYGASVYHSVGYGVPWNGQFKGADLPVGTYYYIIDLKNGDKAATGWVSIIR